MTASLYRLIARAAIHAGLDGLAEWAARGYRQITGLGAFDDREPQ